MSVNEPYISAKDTSATKKRYICNNALYEQVGNKYGKQSYNIKFLGRPPLLGIKIPTYI